MPVRASTSTCLRCSAVAPSAAHTSLRSHHHRDNGALPPVGDGNSGCDGGDQLPALQWLAKQPGICTEVAYPYTSGGGTTGSCKKTCTPFLKIANGVEVPPHNDTALMTAIANYPLSVSVDASDDQIWQLYSGGVVTGKCGTCKSASCLDHGVGGIGYGTSATGVDYWQIKNSWGTCVPSA